MQFNNILFEFLFQFLIAAGCSIAFSVFFRAPKASLILSGICGGIGWLLYFIISKSNFSYVTAVFTATLVIGIFAEIFARIKKIPVSIFIISAIIPMVPGAGMYYTMLYAIQNKMKLMALYAYKTLITAGCIAVGIIVSSTIFKILNHISQKSKYPKSRT